MLILYSVLTIAFSAIIYAQMGREVILPALVVIEFLLFALSSWLLWKGMPAFALGW